ncbi:hypothetical protein SAMN05216388_102182 [Halorientalis persicus]|uniref:DUF7322 domain-containing protein n=1 Tax=Halorientalis persicus TaxID=1367881 RepID=A0A1H8T9L5_9EURY|nr:hypothetical protein [Halorientalis persicus]SEO87627.1 hypothetical protein SAMN05216388_102182 [Halorientalis persicus]
MSDDDQRWPHEPDDPGSSEHLEPDPEPDPDPDLGPDVPAVDIPEPPDPDAADVPEGLAGSFWKLVAIFNLALFAVALGPMLAVFRGEWVNGGAVFFMGVAVFFYGYVRYQRAKAAFVDDD